MTTEPRAGSAGYAQKQEAGRTGESLAALSDHLARLLQHADQLLGEWKEHAESVRARLDAEAQGAGAAVARTVETVLADVGTQASQTLARAFGQNAEALRVDLERARQTAADLEEHMRRLAGGAKPTSVDELRASIQAVAARLGALDTKDGAPGRRPRPRYGVDRLTLIFALSANVLLVALLVVVLLGRAPAPAVSSTPPAPLLPVAASAPPPPAPPDAGAPVILPPANPCAAIPLDAPPVAARLVQECVNRLCAPQPPLKLDGAIAKGGPLGKALAACRREDPIGKELLARLLELERDKTLYKLSCTLPERAASGYTVTAHWLAECPSGK